MNSIIKEITAHQIKKGLPSFKVGDGVRVHTKVKEGDGTLLDMRGAGRKSFVRALKAVFGWDDDIQYINFAGNTDLNVLQQVMEKHGGMLTDDDRRRFFERMPVDLAQTAGEVELVIYPGVRELLEKLSADPQVVLGLVTGNVEACARIKLWQFDLHGHFVLGAFGDDHADRGSD